MTYEEYEDKLNNELEDPWSEDGVPYEICDRICEPFRFKNRKAKWHTCNSNEDGFYSRGELSRMVRVGYMTYFQDYEWSFGNFHELDYELLIKLQYYWSKVNDHECSLFSNWRNNIQGPYANYYNNFLDTYVCGLFDDHERPVCNIRRFEMIKYSIGDDEEYVVVKENKYDDLTSTSKEAIHAYQEIFRMMDEGWMVTRSE
nr:hypothetical protein [Tanacetum cinerariifolium]